MDVEAPWCARYGQLVERLPRFVRNAATTFCGLSACVDARVSMHDMDALLGADESLPALFRDLLLDRAARGVGGEVFFDWPDGARWLGARLPIRYALGGTGPHAAMTLAAIGAPAVAALADRSAHMLTQVPPDLLLAEDDTFIPASRIAPRGEARPDIFIFEYTAGEPVGTVIPPRSSRIIVRFINPGLEHDVAFERLTLAPPSGFPKPGAALISGFNSVPRDMLASEYAYAAGLADGWREAGVSIVHLELAGYDSPALVEAALAALSGHYDSLGMSQSEFRLYFGDGELGAGMVAVAKRLGLARICVHADEWAATATTGDPEVELDALMTGSLLAASRAARGCLSAPSSPPAGGRYARPPFGRSVRHGAYTLVSCAAPHLVAPTTTLGLGDTFTGGCLFVLGQAGTRHRDGRSLPSVASQLTTEDPR